MCGIFGISISGDSGVSSSQFRLISEELFRLSQSRGQDASGLALASADEIRIVKHALRPREMMKAEDYKKLFEGNFDGPATLIGHARMETDGAREIHANNQPVFREGVLAVHNGIVVNHRKLWNEELPGLQPQTEVDTEIIPALIGSALERNVSMVKAIQGAFEKIEGMSSVALLFERFGGLALATNNGSLALAQNPARKIFLFASEKWILEQVLKKFPALSPCSLHQLDAGEAFLITPSQFGAQAFRLSGENVSIVQNEALKIRKIKDLSSGSAQTAPFFFQRAGHEKLLEDNSATIGSLRRCSRCILPETFPFIRFDEQGVCNLCRNFVRLEPKGLNALDDLAACYRKTHGGKDCLVALSGGRDSSFVLHYVKTKLGMNPVAYTYDWGMNTDLSRRNISRLCGKLGVEHILISADIPEKRKFIRQNVTAWIKRPRLGTIPLFMAGDKPFFHYAEVLRRRLGLDLVFFGMNPLERTDFKVAFCGFEEKTKSARHYNLSLNYKWKLLLYYGNEYLKNPAYWNSSWMDSLWGFISYYVIPQNHYNFYDYFEWDEEQVVQPLIAEYGWERAPDTENTWRIGDGTASFYNYIYYTAAGFTENDTFRSNQIRQGKITREIALKKVGIENHFRYEAMRWYCDTNKIDFENVIRAVNQMPKLYR